MENKVDERRKKNRRIESLSKIHYMLEYRTIANVGPFIDSATVQNYKV